MRKIVNTIALLCFTAGLAIGQGTTVPENIRQAFAQKVSEAKDLEWEYDAEDQVWEVEYKLRKDEFTTAFSKDGTWLETEEEIKKSALPTAVKERLKSDFSEYSLEEAEKVETSKGIFYEVELERESNGQEMELELVLSADGKVLRQAEEVEDEEEDED